MTTSINPTGLAATAPTVFIVDDDPAIRKSLAMMLQAHGLATAQFASAEEFLAEYQTTQPGCIVLDLRMPGMTGEELLKTLRAGNANIPVIILTGHGDVPVAVRTMKLGLVDFLQKPVEHQVLTDTVQQALRQDATRRAADAETQKLVKRMSRLTPRERELLGMLASGKTSKEIASNLNVSVKTVDNHRAHLLAKLDASNVAELAAMAVRAGLG
ncbi:MAG TPA: response regulator [Tepidisphaeraceae bacterium]|nr:response regulator [Tepidisphaeraceae bacterium]